MPEPTTFHLALDSMTGGVTVSLREDGRLEYLGYNEEQRHAETIEVRPAAWARLLGELDAIGAWKWEKRYEAPEVVTDATGWQLSVAVPAGPAVFSSGYDATPPGFDRMRGAVSDLIGGLPVDAALPDGWFPDELRHFRAKTQAILDDLGSPFDGLKEAPPLVNDLHAKYAARMNASVDEMRTMLREMLEAME